MYVMSSRPWGFESLRAHDKCWFIMDVNSHMDNNNNSTNNSNNNNNNHNNNGSNIHIV